MVAIEVSKPGTAPKGKKVFSEFSSTTNELSVSIRADRSFVISDPSLTADRFVSKEMEVEVSGKTIRVADLKRVDEHGDFLLGSLEINC